MMRSIEVLSPLLLLTVLLLPIRAAGQGFAGENSTPKKVIEFGWDTPSPQALHDNLPQWQDRPFDGIIFSLSDNGGLIFNLQDGDPAKIEPQITLLRGLRWGRFTDNFLLLNCASNMDWTSDADWAIVAAHARLCAIAARTAGCVGIVLDPESYGGVDPWSYALQPKLSSVDFTEYERIVRQRGTEFMNVIQSELPNAKFMTFYQYSELVNELGSINDDAARNRALSTNVLGLLPSFLDGMLQATGSHVEFIDGNERSYWYESPSQFTDAYRVMHRDAQLYVAPELRKKYARQFRAANAVYTDYNFNLQPTRFPADPAVQMSAVQQAQLFESNLYYGLKSSDEYVWVYSENLNWWLKETPRPLGMEAAIGDAESKVNAHKPLGFDTGSSVTTAKIRRLLAKIGL